MKTYSTAPVRHNILFAHFYMKAPYCKNQGAMQGTRLTLHPDEVFVPWDTCMHLHPRSMPSQSSLLSIASSAATAEHHHWYLPPSRNANSCYSACRGSTACLKLPQWPPLMPA
eukprot:1161046-Pelagomonas_calceolata.AAC.5